MAEPIVPVQTVICAECGHIATDMTPEGQRGTLLCICRPCDVLWRVEEI